MGETAYINGPQQWLRQISLQLADAAGNTTDFSDFRVTFRVNQFEIQTPNAAEIRIYNVAEDTIARMKREATKVVLQAGYPTNIGTIFSGTIVQTRRGRTNAADTFMEVVAGDSSIGYNSAVVSTTLAAGTTAEDVIRACATAFAPFGITLSDLPTNVREVSYPRGVVLYGMARDILRRVSTNLGHSWSILNGRLIFVPQEGALPGDVVVLTSASGMIGIPQQTQDGILVRCLLNPLIAVGQQVHINNASINPARFSPAYLAAVQNSQFDAPTSGIRIAEDGFYRVLVVDYSGDTRGQDWYCDLTCVTLDGALPISQAARGRVLPTTGGFPP